MPELVSHATSSEQRNVGRSALQPNKIEADQALVDGLISIQEYSKFLVSVEPLVDTLSDADERVRKAATFRLKQRGDREAAELLAQALDDVSEEVRLFAAEALEKIDTIYNEAINDLIILIRKKPTARLHYLLGKVYFDYAASGMYDTGMRVIYYEKAIEEFERAVAMSTQNEKLMIYLATCKCEIGNYGDGLVIFEELLSRYPESVELLVKVASIYFALHRYDALRDICQKILVTDESAYRPVVSIWT